MADQFTRLGPPLRVPFTALSAKTPFNMEGKLPTDAAGNVRSDLVFWFCNPTLYDVRLEGTRWDDDSFNQVTAESGWLVLARTKEGPYTSKKPRAMSCQAFSTHGAPMSDGADFTNCFLELQYGIVSR
jgi:hypothetical protein